MCVLVAARIEGRFSGRLDGKSFMAQVQGQELHGRMGGTVKGKDVHLQFGTLPPMLAALVAVCADKALEDEHVRAGAAIALPSP